MPPDRADQAISPTDLQKNTRSLLDMLASGKRDRYVVMRDNRPAAVMLSTARYESLLNELEGLRMEARARERLYSIDEARLISHEEMMARFREAG
jgi:antitoxin StbD